MKKIFQVLGPTFIVFFLVIFSGCATLQGLKEDIRSAKETVFSQIQTGGATSTPSAQCEPVYRRENSSSRYRACLAKQLEASLSPEDLDRLYYEKAFPKCLPMYRDPNADWQEYRKCQTDEWMKVEVVRLVRWRGDIARRDAASRPESIVTRKAGKGRVK